MGFKTFRKRYPCATLLFGLILVVVSGPWVGPIGNIALFVLLLIGGLVAMARHRGFVILGGVFGAPLLLAAIGFALARDVGDVELNRGLVLLFGVPFMLLTTAVVLHFVLTRPRVTVDTLLGSLSAYMLLALSWSAVYGLVLLLDPSAFGDPGPDFEEMIYFSVVTITTLGFGDITPESQLARILTGFEALMGVFYLAFVVARLVSLYGQHHAPSPGEDDGSN